MSVVPTVNLAGGWAAVRMQGNRPTCLAFTMSELNRVANKLTPDLSPEYLYRAAARRMAKRPDNGLRLDAALLAVGIDGQPEEQHCTYRFAEPVEHPPALPPMSTTLHSWPIQPWAVSVPDVVLALGQGKPVGLIIKLTPTFYAPNQGVVAYSPMVIPDCHHAVIAIGHGIDPANGQTFFSIRNSWGTGWGLGGSAWLPADYINQHAVIAFSS